MAKKFNSFYKTVDGNEGGKCHYPTRLDTFGCGCQHDCKYCYAKALLDFRGLWKPEEPEVSSIYRVRRKIRELKPGDVVRLGGMTDCFMPLERKAKITYQTIKLLNRKRVEYLIVTKSDLVADDFYMNAMDKDLAHIQITVTTTDDRLSTTYEKASVPSKRIAAVEKLQRAGFDVQVRLSPFIPEFIDFEKLNAIKCDKILIEFLRVNHWIKRWFDIDYSDYTVSHGGYKQLPLIKKIDYLKNITGFDQMSVCEDEDQAYKYWQEHYNYNPDDCCNLRRSNTV